MNKIDPPPAKASGYVRLSGHTYPFKNGKYLKVPRDEGFVARAENLLDSESLERLHKDMLRILDNNKTITSDEVYTVLHETGQLPGDIPLSVICDEVIKLRRKYRLFRPMQTKRVVELLLAGEHPVDIVTKLSVHRETVSKIKRALYSPNKCGSLTQKFIDGIQRMAKQK